MKHIMNISGKLVNISEIRSIIPHYDSSTGEKTHCVLELASGEKVKADPKLAYSIEKTLRKQAR